VLYLFFRRCQRTEMAKGHPKIRARYAIWGAGFGFRDVGTGILAEEGRRKDLLPPILPPWRRQRLVVYCNGRCTGAAGRRTRPHPAFWELRSLPRIYEVINEIKNAAGKRRKKNRKKNSPRPSKWNRARYLVLAPHLDSISLYCSCGKCQG